MSLCRQLVKEIGAERFQDFESVPKVFGLFPPLMQVFDRRLLERGGKGAAALAVYASEPKSQNRPAAFTYTPTLGPRPRLRQRLAHLLQRPLFQNRSPRLF